MKKHFIRISAALLTVAIVAMYSSCKGEDDDPTLFVTPLVTDIVFSADGNTVTANGSTITNTFTVWTNQGEWKVESSETWVTHSKVSDEKFSLSVIQNDLFTAPKPAVITITAGKASAVTINVTQLIADATLSVLPAGPIDLKADGESAELTVHTNVDEWNVESEDEDWLTVAIDKDDKKFTVTAIPNTDLLKRTTNVIVTAAGATDFVIVVNQAESPPLFTVNGSVEDRSVDVDPAGDQIEFEVFTNHPDGWEAESSQGWVKVGNTTQTLLVITADENPYSVAREATVTITAGAVNIVLTIVQDGNEELKPIARTNKIWVVESEDGTVKQEWTDYIKYDPNNQGTTVTTLSNTSVGPGTGGTGFYVKHPSSKFDYCMYNWYFVVQNQEGLCPSPWRVPNKADIVNLDKGLGGMAINATHISDENNKVVIGFRGAGNSPTNIAANIASLPEGADEYMQEMYIEKMGFEWSGRVNGGANSAQYTDDSTQWRSFMYTSEEADSDAGTNKGSHLNIRKDERALLPMSEYDTSTNKAAGLAVRCVRDVK